MVGWTTTQQWNNDISRTVYKQGDQLALKLLSAGKITSAEQSATSAKFVVDRFKSLGFPIPPKLAAQLGLDSSHVTTSLPSQIAQTGAPATVAAVKVGALQASRNVIRGAWPIAVGVFLLEGCHTAYKYAKGSIDGAEACKRIAESAGSGVGGLAGAALGAAAGTAICPVIGTAIGGVLGGLGGGVGLRKAVSSATRRHSA